MIILIRHDIFLTYLKYSSNNNSVIDKAQKLLDENIEEWILNYILIFLYEDIEYM